MDSSLAENMSNYHCNVSGKRNKKGPLPMKMRALPESFWKQPNTLAEVSPTIYCPPLGEDVESTSQSKVVGVVNTELLFSLFHSIESVEMKSVKQPTLIRRGRPRKEKSKSISKYKKDLDPYFTSAAMPHIQIQRMDKKAQEQEVLAMISSVDDKSHQINNSYSEKLSNLVVNL